MRTTTTISQSIRCSKVFGQPFDKFGYLVADWLQCPLMTAKADIESNQRDQIIHPGRDWLRGRGEDRAHEDSSVRPSNKSINNFVCS
jgi:hypothetical protein